MLWFFGVLKRLLLLIKSATSMIVDRSPSGSKKNLCVVSYLVIKDAPQKQMCVPHYHHQAKCLMMPYMHLGSSCHMFLCCSYQLQQLVDQWLLQRWCGQYLVIVISCTTIICSINHMASINNPKHYGMDNAYQNFVAGMPLSSLLFLLLQLKSW